MPAAKKKKAARKAPAKKKAPARKKAAAKKKAASKAAVSPPKKGAKANGGLGSKGGRPPFEPTPEDRKRVEAMAGLIRHDQIALLVLNPHTGEPITTKTLRRHFTHELEAGVAKAHAAVAQSLFKRATNPKGGAGAVTAGIWYSKCQMGWKERQVVEVESKTGVLVPPPGITADDWIEAAKKRAAESTEPGAEDVA